MTAHTSRRLLVAEIVIVLALSLGRSGIYAVLELLEALSRGPLAAQQTALNSSVSDQPWIDLVQQLVGIVFTLAPVALVILLLTVDAGSLRQAIKGIGMDLGRPLRDLLQGVLLTAAIGLPGLAVYYLGRAVGATIEVVPAALDQHWWTVPVLILHALKNALLEEVVAVGYLVQRLERLGLRPPVIVALSALLRGSYHLYQGIGPGLANLAMGIVFGEWYRRTRRTLPLVVAHTLIDVFAFVGYTLLKDLLPL